MALPTCTLDASEVSQLVTAQNPRIYLEILQKVNTESPWANIIPSSPTEANMGDTIESVVTPRAVTNQDQVEPAFTNFTSTACTLEGPVSQMGNIRFSTQLEILRGETEYICLFANWDTVYGALAQSIQALKSEITYLYNTDTKSKLVRYSGLKASVQEGLAPQASTEGGEWQVQVDFPAALPTSNITFAWTKAFLNYLTEVFEVQMFGSGADQHAKLITSASVVDAFRNEIGPAGPNTSLIAGTTGGYSDAKKALWEFLWQESNFRGLKFAVDRYPLRYNEVDGDGYPIWIAPRNKQLVTATNAGSGYRLAPNPAWAGAMYEVAVLVFQDSFRRRVPQQFVAQGEIKYPSQNFGGDLQWSFLKDQCNKWGDKGQFLYQIARAYQVGAAGAHSIIPIVFKRCLPDYGLSTCSSLEATGSSLASS